MSERDNRGEIGDSAVNSFLRNYHSVKNVQAAKIKSIQYKDSAGNISTEFVEGANGVITLIGGNNNTKEVNVPHSWLDMYLPTPGGYYVVFPNGVAMFKHKVFFESEFSLVNNE